MIPLSLLIHFPASSGNPTPRSQEQSEGPSWRPALQTHRCWKGLLQKAKTSCAALQRCSQRNQGCTSTRNRSCHLLARITASGKVDSNEPLYRLMSLKPFPIHAWLLLERRQQCQAMRSHSDFQQHLNFPTPLTAECVPRALGDATSTTL